MPKKNSIRRRREMEPFPVFALDPAAEDCSKKKRRELAGAKDFFMDSKFIWKVIGRISIPWLLSLAPLCRKLGASQLSHTRKKE